MNRRKQKFTVCSKGKYYESENSMESVEAKANQLVKVNKRERNGQRKRQENSLGELTKNFIDYLQSSGDSIININDVVRKLRVKKRRIYDITNVLEGIGYLKKHGKNKIEWVKDRSLNDSLSEQLYEEMFEESEMLRNQMDEVTEREKQLDDMINEIKTSFEKLSEDPDFERYGYVTFDDIKELTVKENINLIAIKAPQGTSVEIPDPDHINKVYKQTYEDMKAGREEYDPNLLDSLSKKFQIFLDSPNGEIMLYLVMKKENESQVKQEPLKEINETNWGYNHNSSNFMNFSNKSSFQTPNNLSNVMYYGNVSN